MTMPYLGGKANLSKWIISQFPDNYREMTYAEVFGGAGWVIFKKEPSKVDVWNDINPELYNVFKQIVENYDEFRKLTRWMLSSRQLYTYIKKRYIKEQDLVKRAVYFVYAITNSYGCLIRGFKVGIKERRINNWIAFVKRLKQIHLRFSNVIIENLDYKQCIEKYDSTDALFYLDPPYLLPKNEYHYKLFQKNKFTLEDHLELADILRNIKGKFLLSYYPHKIIEKEYKGFEFLTKEVPQNVSSGIKKRRGIELLIKNF